MKARHDGRPLTWMVAVSLLSWGAITAFAGGRVNPEVLCGMAGPLVVAAASWIMTKRTYAAAPERLMGVLLMGMIVRAVLFGAYVVIMLRIVGLRPAPFVFSFTAYFIALYGIEALFMKRLFNSNAESPTSS